MFLNFTASLGLYQGVFHGFFIAHYVLLKHYYSVDFPWWLFFHFTVWWPKRKNLLNDRNSKLHFVIWPKNCFRRISSVCSSGLRFYTNLQTNLDANSMDGFSLKNLLHQNLLYLLQSFYTVNGLNCSKFWSAFWKKV